jgi:hypothetical protein
MEAGACDAPQVNQPAPIGGLLFAPSCEGRGEGNEMTLKNLTPHEIRIVGTSVETLAVLPPSGSVARVSMTREVVGEVAGLPVYRSQYGFVVGLPDAEAGVALVVSAMVRLAVPGRADVYSPGELVRGTDGQPTGCRGLEGNL